jgi:C1A family cysteine protease
VTISVNNYMSDLLMKPKSGKVALSASNKVVGTGWLPPKPDLRDYTSDQKEIKALSKKIGINKSSALPESVDLRKWCSKVEDQGQLGSCTAHAAVGIVEYYQKRAFNKYMEGSRLFVYKATRNLMQETGDTGGWLRCAMGALKICGVPDEKYWPYEVENFDLEPDAFVYSIADDFEALKYFCHDPIGSRVPFPKVLESVKKYLAAGIPSMFGFWGFPSFEKSDVPGGIPYPCTNESASWGHAVITVGYDDKIKINNTYCDKETTGALLIRNSWGKEWGDKGYGWLPYDYVLNNLAMDFWSLLKMDWVDSNQFGI